MNPRDTGTSTERLRHLADAIRDHVSSILALLAQISREFDPGTATGIWVTTLATIEGYNEQRVNIPHPPATADILPPANVANDEGENLEPPPEAATLRPGIDKSKILKRHRKPGRALSELTDHAILVFMSENRIINIPINLDDIMSELARLNINSSRASITSKLSKWRGLGLILPVARGDEEQSEDEFSRSGQYKLAEKAQKDVDGAIAKRGVAG